MPKSLYLNSSILNAIAVIRALQRSKHHPLGTRDIAQCAGITHDQSYRALITLESAGIVNCVINGRRWLLSDGVSIPHRRKNAKRTA